ILHKNNKTENKRMTELRDFLITGVLASIEQVELGGHPNKRLPNNAHFIFTGVNSEQLVLELDKNGIAVSNGSACLSLKEEYSYVVFACGKGKKKSSEAVRFSLGKNTNKKDIEHVLVVLPKVIKKLRKLS
ncbi:cysteine desulfurase NifS, partial [Candidatus Falkowbacteria bacterium CG10_big_fil_rev_8_21_14_0_10_37_6]